MLAVLSLLKPPAGFPDLRRLLQLALTAHLLPLLQNVPFQACELLERMFELRSTMKEERLNVESEDAKTPSIRLREIFQDGSMENSNARRLKLVT